MMIMIMIMIMNWVHFAVLIRLFVLTVIGIKVHLLKSSYFKSTNFSLLSLALGHRHVNKLEDSWKFYVVGTKTADVEWLSNDTVQVLTRKLSSACWRIVAMHNGSTSNRSSRPCSERLLY